MTYKNDLVKGRKLAHLVEETEFLKSVVAPPSVRNNQSIVR